MRVPVTEISGLANTQGVRLISLSNEELLVSVEKVATLSGVEGSDESQSTRDND